MGDAKSMTRSKRIGVYIDGYNLYYGGRGLVGGKGISGWRWLDLRALIANVVTRESGWHGDFELRVVYCTARINGPENVTGQQAQDAYLRALVQSSSVDVVALGSYVSRVVRAPLAVPNKKGNPVLVNPAWPLMVQDSSHQPVSGAIFMASVAKREEKGSDVNVASHLLIDTLSGKIDAAVVVSNDSDLAFPLAETRKLIPTGTINPSTRYTAGALSGAPGDGVGSHWWYKLSGSDLRSAQLNDTVGTAAKPAGW